MNYILFALAAPVQGRGQETVNPIVNLLPIVFIFLIFYFLLIKPQQRRQKEQQTMLLSLKKNDEVITSGGLHGTIMAVKERTFIIRVDENTKLEIEKNCIATVKKTRSN